MKITRGSQVRLASSSWTPSPKLNGVVLEVEKNDVPGEGIFLIKWDLNFTGLCHEKDLELVPSQHELLIDLLQTMDQSLRLKSEVKEFKSKSTVS
jgi:hypothetical protein